MREPEAADSATSNLIGNRWLRKEGGELRRKQRLSIYERLLADLQHVTEPFPTLLIKWLSLAGCHYLIYLIRCYLIKKKKKKK